MHDSKGFLRLLSFYSLDTNLIGGRNGRDLEDGGPEAGKLVAVVDLDDMELLNNAAVKSEFISLEARQNFSSKVDEDEGVELLCSLLFALITFELVLDSMDIVRALEHGVHGLLACSDSLNVSLCLSDLFCDSLACRLLGLKLVEGSLERAEVVDLSFNPMVQVRERVAKVLNSVTQAFNQISCFLIIDDETRVILISVVGETVILIGSQSTGSASIGFDQALLAGEVTSHVVLHLLQERLSLFDEHLELEKLCVKDVSLLLVHALTIELSCVLHALNELARGHLDKPLKRLLNIEALWTRKNLELLSINNKIESAEFAEVALEIEAALLQENNILVTHGLLRWHLGKKDSRPALAQAFLEEEEFVIAALHLKFTLGILASDNVNDVATMVLWVTNSVLEGTLIQGKIALVLVLGSLGVDVRLGNIAGCVDSGRFLLTRLGISFDHNKLLEFNFNQNTTISYYAKICVNNLINFIQINSWGFGVLGFSPFDLSF